MVVFSVFKRYRMAVIFLVVCLWWGPSIISVCFYWRVLYFGGHLEGHCSLILKSFFSATFWAGVYNVIMKENLYLLMAHNRWGSTEAWKLLGRTSILTSHSICLSLIVIGLNFHGRGLANNFWKLEIVILTWAIPLVTDLFKAFFSL